MFRCVDVDSKNKSSFNIFTTVILRCNRVVMNSTLCWVSLLLDTNTAATLINLRPPSSALLNTSWWVFTLKASFLRAENSRGLMRWGSLTVCVQSNSALLLKSCRQQVNMRRCRNWFVDFSLWWLIINHHNQAQVVNVLLCELLSVCFHVFYKV